MTSNEYPSLAEFLSHVPAGKRVAYTVVRVGREYALAVAVEGCPGYYPSVERSSSKALVADVAKALNAKNGLTEREAALLVADTMFVKG